MRELKQFKFFILKIAASLGLLFNLLFCVAQDASYSWCKQLTAQGTSYVQVKRIMLDSSGNIYTIGNFSASVDFDPGIGVFNLVASGGGSTFILKLDPNGNFVWAKKLGNLDLSIRAIAVNYNSIYITGSFSNTIDFDPSTNTYNMTALSGNGLGGDAVIARYDTACNFIWAKQIWGLYSVEGISLGMDASNNCYIAGQYSGTVDFDPGSGTYNQTSASTNGKTDGFLLKLNSSGIFIWVKSVGGSQQDQALQVILNQQREIFISGIFANTADFDPGTGVYNLTATGSSDMFICKFDSSGNFIWAKKIAGTVYEVPTSILLDSFLNIYATGYYTGIADFDPGSAIYNLASVGVNDNAFILKLDSSGGFRWAKKFDGRTRGYSIGVDRNSSSYTTGYFSDTIDFNPSVDTFKLVSKGNVDIFIIKLDSAGSFTWAKQIGGTQNDIGNCNWVTSSGIIFTAGEFQITADFDPGFNSAALVSGGAPDGFIQKMVPCTSTSSSVNLTVCDRLVYNGKIYSNSGTYIQKRANNKGCDSTIVINLIVKNSSYNQLTYSPCDSITVNSKTYYSSGTFFQVFTNSRGCDSIITLVLDIRKSYVNNLIINACDSFRFNNILYTSSGNHKHLFTNTAGCDSIINLNLTIRKATSSIMNISSCSSFKLNNQVYSASGTFIQKIANQALCDSIITLNLTILSNTSSSLSITACESYTLNNKTYIRSGSYYQTLQNSKGCDSIITLNLTILKSSFNSITATACDYYLLNGKTYNTSGIYTQTLMNASGCDSLITLMLTINLSNVKTIAANSCKSFLFNGKTYSSSGIYPFYNKGINGCDSNVFLNLTINNTDSSVIQNGNILMSNAFGAQYQWIDCSNKIPLPGKISQSLTAQTNGDFAVIIKQNGCVDTSLCYAVRGVGIKPFAYSVNINLHPNPFQEQIILNSNMELKNPYFRIINVSGQVVHESIGYSDKEFVIEPGYIPPGIYLLEIMDATFIQRIKIIKD